MCGNGRDRKFSSFSVGHVGVMVETREVRCGAAGQALQGLVWEHEHV